MWSYFHPFARMTKEMRPSHCENVLAHTLAYYGQKKNKIGMDEIIPMLMKGL